MMAEINALKERVAKLKMKHQASHNAQGGTRPGYKDIETNDVREMPGPIHPIVRTHPVTGRKALFLGRRFGAYVPGPPPFKGEGVAEGDGWGLKLARARVCLRCCGGAGKRRRLKRQLRLAYRARHNGQLTRYRLR